MQTVQQDYLDVNNIASRHLAALHVLMVHQRLHSTNIQTLCIHEKKKTRFTHYSNHSGSLPKRQPGICIHERKAACAQEVVEQVTAKQVESPSNKL